MKLFYSKGACSLIIRIILNEIGVPFESESVNLKTKKTEHDLDYVSINPKGSVPALLLENGMVLTENAVIMQYLADHYQAVNLLPLIDDFQRYRVLEWMNYLTTDIHKGFGPLFNPNIPQDIKDQIFKPLLVTKFKYIDKQLQHPYLLGKHVTLPDAYLYVMLRWATSMALDIESCQHLHAYKEQLQIRKSIVDALQQEGL